MNSLNSPARTPKYQQVFNSLQQDILSGKYQPGDKLPSEAALEKRFGASRITVGRAVRDLAQRNLIVRKAGSGTFVHAPKTSGSLFGLLIPNLGQTEIFEPICQGMSDAAGEHALLWGRTMHDGSTRGAEALRLCRQHIERQVAGVFFAPLEHPPKDSHINREIIASLEEARIPIVLLDRDFLPYPQRSRYDLVGIDNRRAGYVATEHLLKLGCRRIGFWAYPFSVATVEARIAGYHEALLAFGTPIENDLVQRFDPGDAQEVARFMEATHAEALVCANDSTAGSLMHSLLRGGFRVPDDVRIVGIDDVRYASLLPVPLTTVHQPCRDIGIAAMAVMRERLAQPTMAPRDVLLSCELVVRESCGAKKTNAKSPDRSITVED